MRSFWRSTRTLFVVLAGAALATLSPQQAQAQTEPSYKITGKAVNAEGVGIANVTVRIDGTTKTTLTSASGEYSLTGLAAGTFTVLARKEGLNFEPASRTLTLPTAGEPYSPNGQARFVGRPVTSMAIGGRILNGDGLAMGGVRVTLTKTEGTFTPRILETNSEGRYNFVNVPKGSYSVKPSREGWRFEPVQAGVTLPTTGFEYSPNARLNFKGIRLTGTLKVLGLVKTTAGLPIAGVKIYRGKTVVDGAVPVATSNSEGRFAVENLAAGTYYFIARLSGYRFEPAVGSATVPTTGQDGSPNGRVVFIGTKEAVKYAIRGKVTNATGAALVGVTIKIANKDLTAVTSTSGEYAIEGLVTGTYSLSASKTNFTFTPVSKSVTLPTSGEPYSPAGRANFVGTEKVSRYAVRGKVTNPAGTGIAGVTVRIGNDGPSATTSTSGEYAIEGLAAGTYTLKPSKTNLVFSPVSKSVTLPTSGEPYSPAGRADFVGREPEPVKYAIRGKVTNGAGSGIAGVTIKIGNLDLTATTSTSGEFAIEGLAAGTYSVTAAKTRFTFTPASQNVTLPTSGQTYSPNGRVEFVGKEEVAVKYAIRGKVTNGAGAALSGVTVRIGMDGPSATTSTSGEFAIEGLAAGTYAVSASKTNFTFTPATKSVTLPTTGEPYSPNGRAEFVGTEKPSTYYIRGRVTVSTSSVGLAGVEIFLNDATVPAAVTAEEGRFTINNLRAGTYVLHPKASGYSFSPATKTIILPTSGLAVSPNGNAEFTASR